MEAIKAKIATPIIKETPATTKSNISIKLKTILILLLLTVNLLIQLKLLDHRQKEKTERTNPKGNPRKPRESEHLSELRTSKEIKYPPLRIGERQANYKQFGKLEDVTGIHCNAIPWLHQFGMILRFLDLQYTYHSIFYL